MADLSLLTSFVRAAEHGSFSAAARSLGLTAAAVSKNVARLESLVGVRLFHRSTRRLALTERGERFLAQVRDPLTALDGALAGVREHDDVAAVMDALGATKADVVAHDIGNMVAFQVAARYPQRVRRLVLIDAPVPGVGPWDEVLKNPLLWHFRFGGPDMERLVAGRERIYLDRFWNEFSASPDRFTEAARVHYAALYAMPGAMHSGFAQFAAFDQDAIDNRAFLAGGGRLKMPVLAVGGAKSFGPMMATVMRAAADDVTEAQVPDSGHWIMEENPGATTKLVTDFLSR